MEDEMDSRLGMLPRRKAGPDLGIRLRVMASSEAKRRRLLSSPKSIAREILWRGKLWLDNLARPYALPCAGGVISALFLFLSIAPAFPMRQTIVNDVPVRLTTQATLISAFSFSSPGDTPLEDVVVDVEVDSEGRVMDYSVPGVQAWASNPAMRKSLESTLLWTRFNPATLFGQPQAGTVRITIRRNELEVRG